MAFNTPMYQPYTPAREAGGGGEPNWGQATPGGNTGYENNYRDQAFSQVRSIHGGQQEAGGWGQEASQASHNNAETGGWGQDEIKKEQPVQSWG